MFLKASEILKNKKLNLNSKQTNMTNNTQQTQDNTTNMRRYDKIYAYWKEETKWILNGECIIQEKIDGANMSAYVENWNLKIASRNRELTPDESFRWAREYIENHQGILKLLADNKNYILYGEWLVKHTIWNYNANAYNKFHIFDIFNKNTRQYLNPKQVVELAKEYWILAPTIFAVLINPTEEEVRKYVWKSVLWPTGEGVVIKNINFVNVFWNRNYAKIVAERFSERKYITDPKKKEEIKLEEKMHNIATMYATEGRVAKIINKIEQNGWKDISKEDIPQILKMVVYDIITEEALDISETWVVDFKMLKKTITREIFQVLKKIWLIK